MALLAGKNALPAAVAVPKFVDLSAERPTGALKTLTEFPSVLPVISFPDA